MTSVAADFVIGTVVTAADRRWVARWTRKWFGTEADLPVVRAIPPTVEGSVPEPTTPAEWIRGVSDVRNRPAPGIPTLRLTNGENAVVNTMLTLTRSGLVYASAHTIARRGRCGVRVVYSAWAKLAKAGWLVRWNHGGGRVSQQNQAYQDQLAQAEDPHALKPPRSRRSGGATWQMTIPGGKAMLTAVRNHLNAQEKAYKEIESRSNHPSLDEILTRYPTLGEVAATTLGCEPIPEGHIRAVDLLRARARKRVGNWAGYLRNALKNDPSVRAAYYGDATPRTSPQSLAAGLALAKRPPG